MNKFYEENKIIIVVSALLIVGLGVIALKKSGEPAAEDRFVMDHNAKRASDSLARALDSCLADPMKEINAGVAPVVTTTATAPTNTTGH